MNFSNLRAVYGTLYGSDRNRIIGIRSGQNYFKLTALSMALKEMLPSLQKGKHQQKPLLLCRLEAKCCCFCNTASCAFRRVFFGWTLKLRVQINGTTLGYCMFLEIRPELRYSLFLLPKHYIFFEGSISPLYTEISLCRNKWEIFIPDNCNKEANSKRNFFWSVLKTVGLLSPCLLLFERCFPACILWVLIIDWTRRMNCFSST